MPLVIDTHTGYSHFLDFFFSNSKIIPIRQIHNICICKTLIILFQYSTVVVVVFFISVRFLFPLRESEKDGINYFKRRQKKLTKVLYAYMKERSKAKKKKTLFAVRLVISSMMLRFSGYLCFLSHML